MFGTQTIKTSREQGFLFTLKAKTYTVCIGLGF